MEKFTARMAHNKDTIMRLSVTQYNCFQFKGKIIRVVIAVALIAYGLYADQTMITPIVCLILGCLLIANVNLRARVRANKVIEHLKGNYPKSAYSFTAKGFSDEKDGKIIPYDQIIKLVEDREYFYLYISEESAYMVDKSTVSGGSVDEFKDYLSRRTDEKWVHPNSLLTFSIKSLRSGRDDYEGPRLK